MPKPTMQQGQTAKLPEPHPSRRRGPTLMVQGEVDKPIASAFREECQARGMTQQAVLQYLISNWLIEKNPPTAKKLGLLT